VPLSRQFITALEHPRCPRCQRRMKLEDVSLGPEGFESRLFECFKCHHAERRAVPSDPIKSNVVRWLAGELKAPQ
jgi:tRNA(Ile2) C34 agmatinyltransferase TiaS